MTNHPCDRNRQNPPAPPSPSGYSEPEVRRWPHPVCGTVPSEESDACLHYIRCALVYQNQLLADIKTLLEQLNLRTAAPAAESLHTTAEK